MAVAYLGLDLLVGAQIKGSSTAQGAWTPLWAAPEVFRHERATLKADIWSFGIILYELVGAPAALVSQEGRAWGQPLGSGSVVGPAAAGRD